ncbi:MAG: hypothetical protein ABFS46_13010 [Myxococcota bacterium]
MFRVEINKVLGELRDWREKHPAAKHATEAAYQKVARLLRDARRIETLPELETRLRDVRALIIREGPVSDEFLPSLEELHQRVTDPGR